MSRVTRTTREPTASARFSAEGYHSDSGPAPPPADLTEAKRSSTTQLVREKLRQHSESNLEYDKACYLHTKEFVHAYSGFFKYHLLPTLGITEAQWKQMRNSGVFKLCNEVLVGSKPASELETMCVNTLGQNFQSIEWIVAVHSALDIPSIMKADLDPDNLFTEYKDHLNKFASMLRKTQIPFDTHTMVVFNWWLPQLLEMISMTICVTKALPSGKKTLFDPVASCYDYFKNSTICTVYLLCGEFLYNKKWFDVIASLKQETAQAIPVQSVEEKSRTLAHNIRRHVHEARKRREGVELPKTRYHYNYSMRLYYDRIYEEMLLEPRFGILSAICRLAVVKHDDEEIGRSIIRYCGVKEKLLALLKTAISHEVATTSTFDVLFRGESIATKLMSILFFSPYGGQSYLQRVVQPLINEVDNMGALQSELDLSSDRTMQLISQHCEEFLRRVYRSTHLFPLNVRLLLSFAQQEVARKFPEMRQRVVGGFFFLRFLCPSLVNPTRFNLRSGTPYTQRVIVQISRILQCMANGTKFDSSKGTLVKLNGVIESNLEKLHQYFDRLADTTHVGADSMKDFKNISQETVLTDFRSIIVIALDLHKELREIVSKGFPESFPLCVNFVHLSHPNIFQFSADESGYGKLLNALADSLPPNAIKRLLGVQRGSDGLSGPFSWHLAKSKNFTTINQILGSVRYYREETREFLQHIFELHDYVNYLFSKWNAYAKVPQAERQAVFTRRLLMLAFMMNQMDRVAMPFCFPEVMECWMSFRQLVEQVIELMITDTLAGSDSSQRARDALCLLVVHIRWTITRLVTLQNAQRVTTVSSLGRPGS